MLALRAAKCTQLQAQKVKLKSTANDIFKVSQITFVKYEQMWDKNEEFLKGEEERIPTLGKHTLTESAYAFIYSHAAIDDQQSMMQFEKAIGERLVRRANRLLELFQVH
jgi:hypothetical protein